MNMYVIEKKIEIFFGRVDTAWRIIEQDTSRATTLICLVFRGIQF